MEEFIAILFFIGIIITAICCLICTEKHSDEIAEVISNNPLHLSEMSFKKKHPIIYKVIQVIILSIAIIWLLGECSWYIVNNYLR